MIYKVWSQKGKSHLWTYEDFKAEVHAVLVDYKLDGNCIDWIKYEVKEPIPPEVFKRYGFKFEAVKNNK